MAQLFRYEAERTSTGTAFLLHEREIDQGVPFAWVPGPDPRGIGEACIYYCTELDPGGQIYRGPCGDDCNTFVPEAYAAVFEIVLR